MRNDLQHATVSGAVLARAARRPRRLALADVQAFDAPVRQSRHASRRAAQRNLAGAIEYILTWGRLIQRTGVRFYFLGRRDIPAQHRHLPQIARLAGSVALVSSDGEVITLYRNVGALRDIQRKLKYRFTPRYPLIGADRADAERDDEDAQTERVG
ncbi:MAG: hypothetical protein ACHQ1E_13290 [Ktedonobacterales bacterium]